LATDEWVDEPELREVSSEITGKIASRKGRLRFEGNAAEFGVPVSINPFRAATCSETVFEVLESNTPSQMNIL